MSELELFMYPGGDDLPSISPPCVKVYLALQYSQLPHELTLVRGRASMSSSGRLPALRVDGEVLSDSVEIMDRLERLAPPRRFWPEEPAARVQDRLWEHYVNQTLYWSGFYLRWCVSQNRKRLLKQIFRGRPVLRRLAGTFLSRGMQARARGQGIGLRSAAEVRQGFARALELVESGLGDGPYLGGRGELGRGDLALGALLPQAGFRGVTPWLADQLGARPSLIAYTRRVYEACGVPVPRTLAG